MRRLGTILMILGANIMVGTVAAAFWRASFECVMDSPEGSCGGEVAGVFVGLFASASGLIYWAALVAGVLVFLKGKRMRAN